jgi:aspartate/methionine/tyrosine aminotransferase
LKISPTVLQISESATLSMPRRVAELRRRGLDIIDFGLGEPDFPSPAPAIAACHQALAEGATRYTEVAGLPALREALAEHYAVRFTTPCGSGHRGMPAMRW